MTVFNLKKKFKMINSTDIDGKIWLTSDGTTYLIVLNISY